MRSLSFRRRQPVLLVASTVAAMYGFAGVAFACPAHERNTICPNKVVGEATVSASSAHSVQTEPQNAVWGTRMKGEDQSFWQSLYAHGFPQWLRVTWPQPETFDRVVLRQPFWTQPGTTVGPTLEQTRLQYWDLDAEQWVDVEGQPGQPNPILDWTLPGWAADGSEIRDFDFDEITTTDLRYYVDQGAGASYSSLEEIEAYDLGSPECGGTPESDLASPKWTTLATANEQYGIGNTGYRVQNVANDALNGYWMDDANASWPDWVQLTFAEPLWVDRVFLRHPGGLTRQARLQYWDLDAEAWADVVGQSGQANPITDWLPVAPGDNDTREFDFEPINTTKMRYVVELGGHDGTSKLAEFEVFGPGGPSH